MDQSVHLWGARGEFNTVDLLDMEFFHRCIEVLGVDQHCLGRGERGPKQPVVFQVRKNHEYLLTLETAHSKYHTGYVWLTLWGLTEA